MTRRTRLVRIETAPNGLELWRTDPRLTPPPIGQRKEYACEVRCGGCGLVMAAGPCHAVESLWTGHLKTSEEHRHG